MFWRVASGLQIEPVWEREHQHPLISADAEFRLELAVGIFLEEVAVGLSSTWYVQEGEAGEFRARTSMAGIHSFIYGIDADAAVRKITVSREAGATVMILNPPHGSDGAPVRTIVQNDRVPLQEAKRAFGLDEAVEVPADLDGSAVGEKVRADLEVRAVARKEASG